MSMCLFILDFFLHCRASDCLSTKWYKFDDGDVTEAKMDDEEVL